MIYSENFNISSHDVDPKGELRPSMVTRYMQEVANHQMRDKQPSYNELFAKGMSFVLSRINIKISGHIRQYDNVSAQTWVNESKGVSFYRSYRIMRDNEVMAEAISIWALVNPESKRLYHVDEVDLSNYPEDEKIDLPTRVRFPKELDLTFVGERKILYSDIDLNMHLNNTNYPDIICNYIPDIESVQISNMFIRFVNEAPYKETLKIFRSQPILNDNGVVSYYFRTLREDGQINIESEIQVKLK